MEKKDYKKEFCALMDRFRFRHSRWQVWNDFLSLSAISLANVMPGPEKEEREKQYLSIINSYQKEEQEVFPQMLGLVVVALDENPEQDFLGSLYHHLELQQEQKGQFFTPYHICHFMSELQFAGDEKEELLKEKGYISVSDKTTPRLLQSHTLENAVKPPFLGGFFISSVSAAETGELSERKMLRFPTELCND